MSHSSHTYGPTCHLARSPSFQAPESDDDVPPVKAQYFYSSPLPIDDPLSVVPVPSGPDSKAVKFPLRPFLPVDNNALEEAWMSFGPKKSKKGKKSQKKGKPDLSKGSTPDAIESLAGKSKKDKPDHTKDHTKYSDDEGKHKKKPEHHKPSSKHSEDEHTGKHKKKPEHPKPSSKHSEDEHTGKHKKKPERPKHSPKHPEHEHTGKSKATPVGGNDSGHQNHGSGSEDKHSKRHARAEATAAAKSAKAATVSVIGGAKQKATNGFKVNKSLAAESLQRKTGSVDGSVDSDGESHHSESECEDLDHVPVEQCCDFTQEPQDEPPKTECCDFTKDSQAENSYPGCDCSDGDGKRKSRKNKSSDRVTFQQGQTDGTSEEPPSNKIPNPEQTHHLLDAPVPLLPSPSGKGKEKEVSDSLGLPNDAGITGQPFVKFQAKYDGQSYSPQRSSHDMSEDCDELNDSQKAEEAEFLQTESLEVPGCKAKKIAKEQADIPVGISRLHSVKMPALQMLPIYWSPLSDIASVTRGTWFYKDTMYPVEPHVANQLEKGFRELRPWSQTWKDELNCALDVGAAGEEKIVYDLWPKDDVSKNASRPKTESHHLSTNPYCAAKCFNGEVAAEGTLDLDDKSNESKVVAKKYSSAQVIYKDAHTAFILKPTLQPSAYYGRKPLQKIKRGMNVGICCVRGFDWKSWEKLHPSKKSQSTKKAVDLAAIAGDADASKRTACPPCEAQKHQPKVKDLVLVVHGIGQKLSERVESFHFTHAVNSFRRSVNMELANEGVQKVLRPDLCGMMVLPVNWRSNLSFEDGGPMKDDDYKPSVQSDFTMKDITPDTIPAVRNMISDVMLDIPFYMSHHKPRMIQAVITEANRVYRLWCKNNPEFHDGGRVHMIAHSLGSAMAVDILSKQPTYVPHIDPTSKKINTKHFDFNCTNLFLAGSPAAFFLLLEKGKLLPRRGRGKPGVEYNDDHDKSLTGEPGKYGCMAVDNVYNIMNYNDPIAYRLNATIDAQYAVSLKNAQVPSATTGFFESIGKAVVRSITPGHSSDEPAVGQVGIKPSPMVRLPSQLEMEVHDFTREELAEKRCYLLNDNGQVDWFLSSGGGPLEIQYINMLSAHSSYWLSPDFVRMIVTECGRTPGKDHTLPNMRVVKVGHKS
ncbi:hypothetical protein HYFRA_00005760 [Hymenoscyphus fraxineus]|uniref:DDHD domain-containing protein n=1 Tax=Hymenoscyphus fraxineus TaxID=746836 RepID=A0A9N9PQY7_9HELO|nr:hypothetical protein HYFRA_00005760 [Hymenoscyphus fraxineus]